jgi:hypothetical protein
MYRVRIVIGLARIMHLNHPKIRPSERGKAWSASSFFGVRIAIAKIYDCRCIRGPRVETNSRHRPGWIENARHSFQPSSEVLWHRSAYPARIGIGHPVSPNTSSWILLLLFHALLTLREGVPAIFVGFER